MHVMIHFAGPFNDERARRTSMFTYVSEPCLMSTDPRYCLIAMLLVCLVMSADFGVTAVRLLLSESAEAMSTFP
jgi:hypothetical protein